MSYDENLQQLQNSTADVTSISYQLSLSSASNTVCEPMFELEGAEFNEEFLKSWLSDGVDFSVTDTAPLSSTDTVQQESAMASEQLSGGGSSDSSNTLQPLYPPHQLGGSMPFQYSRHSPANMQPMLQSGVATPSKRIIKPRAQLSNQEITRLLLIYMSKALASQQNAPTCVNNANKQGCSSSSIMRTNNPAVNMPKSTALPSNSDSNDLLQRPRATNVAQSNSTDSQQSTTTEFTISKSKRKCKKSKSTGTSGRSNGSEPMDCSVTVSKEAYRKNAHSKVRPYNSLDLPKVHDPLGLMDHTENRMHSVQQPKVTSTSGKAVHSANGGTAVEGSSSEMDLSPLVQILETVKTVPNFEMSSKPKKTTGTINKPLNNNNNKEKPQEGKIAPESSDQVTPISDIFNTVNNLPNLMDIQSVLKYVQKRKAMRKLFRRRSHSAGSIDDLKKESKSSASLKAYTELLKAKSQRLQRQLAPDQSLTNLQSCMTTHSTVTDNDFDFLKSIGIDPNTVTTNIKNDLKNMTNATSSNYGMGDKAHQDTQLQKEMPTGFDNLFVPPEDVDSQLFNALQCPNVSSEMLPTDNQPPVLQCNGIHDLDKHLQLPLDKHLQLPLDLLSNDITSELNHMEEDNATPSDVYFIPEWAHTQGMIKVLIHGPFMSSSTQYVCYFDDLPTEAKLEHWGVLSCTCPAHPAGFVTVKIVWGQNYYTCSQQFEYRSLSLMGPNDSFIGVSKENAWRSNLLHRINLLAKSCSTSSEVEKIMNDNKHINLSQCPFEQLILHLLEKLKSVCNRTVLMELKPSCRTTILHIAVLLNLENVIRKIMELVFSNTFPCSWKSEFSPCTQDEEMCSPLMLSCQQGNVTISKLLLEWEPETITLTNFEGVTPIQCALQRGHSSMVAELENWILTISGNQIDTQMDESTESDIRQCPYSPNVYPMSSELYATDLEDILQSSNNDLLQSHQLNANKEAKEATAVTKLSERSFSAQGHSNTLSVNECVVSSIESATVDYSNFSSSPMFVTTNPCIVSNNNSVLTVNELASGSSSKFNNACPLVHQPLSCCNSSGGGFGDTFPISDGTNTSVSCSDPCPDVLKQFGNFRAASPLLSSPSEQSSVISASPSSLSAASDSCSVAEICELLGESPSVCQQDFSFPGLSDSEQREIYHAAKTIQHAFRKHKMQAQRHHHSKEKHAAVLIETYYKKYKEMKQMNQAAVLIQKYYRRYKNSLARSKELERAALFIQQMYRYQHRLKKN